MKTKKCHVLRAVTLAVAFFLAGGISFAGIIAYEGFDYANGDGLPNVGATGSGWSTTEGQEGWRNFSTESGILSRYGINTNYSITAPSGYTLPVSGGVVETIYSTDNTVVYRRTASTLDLGAANVQYFSVLKKNDDAVTSNVSLLTEDKLQIFKMEDRAGNSTRIISDFGNNTFLNANNPWTVDGDSLLIFRLTSDGVGNGTVDFVNYRSGVDTVPASEPESWTTIMTLTGLSDKSLGGVGMGIITANSGAELYDEIRLGDSFTSVIPEPATFSLVVIASSALFLVRRLLGSTE